MEYHINEGSLGKIEYVEAVTINREIVKDHLAYTNLYMFLVAEYIMKVNMEEYNNKQIEDFSKFICKLNNETISNEIQWECKSDNATFYTDLKNDVIVSIKKDQVSSFQIFVDTASGKSSVVNSSRFTKEQLKEVEELFDTILKQYCNRQYSAEFISIISEYIK